MTDVALVLGTYNLRRHSGVQITAQHQHSAVGTDKTVKTSMIMFEESTRTEEAPFAAQDLPSQGALRTTWSNCDQWFLFVKK